MQYGGDVVGGKSGEEAGGEGEGGDAAADESDPEQDEDEAQLDPEILALIEKEVGGAGLARGDICFGVCVFFVHAFVGFFVLYV